MVSRELIPVIVAMNSAAEKAMSSVDEYLSNRIDEALYHLDEEGFPYGNALDIVTEYALLSQCVRQGRSKAKMSVEIALKRLMKNDDLPA